MRPKLRIDVEVKCFTQLDPKGWSDIKIVS